MALVRTNIGGELSSDAAGQLTVIASAGTDTGASIDRYAANARNRKSMSCMAVVSVGTYTSTPSSFSVDVAVQHSTTGTDGWATVGTANIGGSGATSGVMTQIVGTQALRQLDVNLKHVRRYIRFVATTAFVSGTSPTIPVAVIPVFVESESV